MGEAKLTIYCLVSLKLGASTKKFLEEAWKLPNVREAKFVLGRYDAIVVFESADFREMALPVIEGLRGLPGVENIEDHVCP